MYKRVLNFRGKNDNKYVETHKYIDDGSFFSCSLLNMYMILLEVMDASYPLKTFINNWSKVNVPHIL